jgi:hypothetical protein
MYKVIALTREVFEQTSLKRLSYQMPHNQAFQEWQLSMKEMPATRNHCDRQTLWASPIHD